MTHQIDTKRLIAMREMQAWTQDDLAEASGLSARTIQRVEMGEAAALETLRALASAFNVHPNMLRYYKISRDLKWGLIGGFAGLLLGPIAGFIAIWLDVSQGQATGRALGIYAGVWGTALGAMGGLSGIMIGRDQVQFRSGLINEYNLNR
jgi:transcriptional regulator with XRE-family HTH domain